MFYFDTKTKTFGLSLNDVRILNPNISIADDCTSVKNYVGYTETDRPQYNEIYQTIEEDIPVNGKQVWKIVSLENTPSNLEKVTKIVKDKITTYRVSIEEGGVTWEKGVTIKTAVEDQNRLTSMVTAASFADLGEVDFNAGDQWLKVNIKQIQQFSGLIAHHVMLCYAEERRLHEMVDSFANDLVKIANFDYKKEWNINKETAKESMTKIEDEKNSGASEEESTTA